MQAFPCHDHVFSATGYRLKYAWSSWNTWPPSRLCEYDETEIEYWVNTRTSGVLSREDMQRLSISRSHEGEGELGSEGMGMPDSGMEAGGFDDLGCHGDVTQEGDAALQVSKPHASKQSVTMLLNYAVDQVALRGSKASPVAASQCSYFSEAKSKLSLYLKNALKSKTTLCSVADKLIEMSSDDPACKELLGYEYSQRAQYHSHASIHIIQLVHQQVSMTYGLYLHTLRTRDKLVRLIREIDEAYDALAELQAEGDTTGYTEESFG